MPFKDIAYLELWRPFSSKEQYFLCNFSRGHHEEYFYTDVNKNALLIISDFLAMLYKNKQPRLAYLCNCWTRYENDFNLISRLFVILMTSYKFYVHMTALFNNRL